MNNRLPALSWLAASLLAASWTHGAILLNENFGSYSDGLLPTNSPSPWVRFSGNGSGVPVSGGVLYLGQTFSDDVATPLLGQPYDTTNPTNVFYASFTVNFQAAPTGSGGYYFALFKDSGTSTFRSRIFALTNGVATAGTFRLGLANGSGTASATNAVDLNTGTTYTVVARLIAGTNALSSTLWVNPANEASPSISATDAQSSIAVNMFAFREPGADSSTSVGSATLSVDDLVVGTSFVDVVPGSQNSPLVTLQPQDTNGFIGTTISFTTLAVGDVPLAYQWYYNTNTILNGATNTTFTLTNLQLTNAGTYSAVITNSAGTNATRFATLSVSSQPIPPIITNQPTNLVVTLGDSATLFVVAGGSTPLTYQWKSVSGGVTNPVSGAASSNLTFATANFTNAGTYFVTITNQFGSTNSGQATLAVNPPPQVTTAFLHSTVDSVNYRPTNTTSLYTVEGIVTTYADMVSGNNASFYIQDAAGGINVFWPGSPRTNTPNAGDLVRVIGPLTSFNGLLEIAPSFANALHSVTVLSTNNPLPTPAPLPFDPTTVANPVIMDALEGSYLVASNVFLDQTTTIFQSISAGEQFTNTSGQTFTLFVNAQTDLVGRKKPVGPVTIIGVLGQFDNSDPRTSGYQLIASRFLDIIPAVRFTNVLENLVRRGDRPINSFEETVLRPGEKLTMDVIASDPGGGTITITPLPNGLPGTASWANNSPASGPLVTNRFVFQPTIADQGSNYVVALQVATSLQTGTNTWNVYVPTSDEQKVFISEFFATPTTTASSPAFNPLKRANDTNNVAVNDQFVEIANLSGATLDLLNWTLGSDVATRHKFFNGSFGSPAELLTSSNCIVVYGGPLNGDLNPPNLSVSTFPANVGSSPSLALSANGGVLTLHNGSGYLVDRVVYAAADLSPTNSSLSRFPTPNDVAVAQAYVSTNFVSAGLQYDGSKWDLPFKVPIGISNITVTAGNPLTLSFTANTGSASTLWQTDSLTNRFRVVTGRQFTSPDAIFLIPNTGGQQFFYITR